MAQLDLTNVFTISVSAAPAGVGQLNTSNLAIFSHEVPGSEFGTDGYKIYKNPSAVTADFGSDSRTSDMAVAGFSQKPNILAGGGYLVVIPYVDTAEVQTLTFSADPTSGSYKLNYGSYVTEAIVANSTAAQVQAALRLLAPLRSVTVTGSEATLFTVTFAGVHGNATALTVSDNTLNGGITIAVATPTPGVAETLEDAINRTKDLVQYFGIMTTVVLGQAELLDAAALVQTLVKLLYSVQVDSASVDVGGTLDLLRTGGLKQTRGLLYIGVAGDPLFDRESAGLNMQAAYGFRGQSTDFSGSNTTQNMHLKDLITIQPDAGMTQTILTKCQAAGADVYASFQGVPKVYCSGKNDFYDRQYNLLWIVAAFQVAGFNVLAQTGTKIAQTEQGIGVIKGALRTVCEQGVTNQYLAPGSWTSPDTFGILDDFFRNIQERGYYIYSSPVATQLKADREARIAPLIQIALKEAGAVDRGNVLISINP